MPAALLSHSGRPQTIAGRPLPGPEAPDDHSPATMAPLAPRPLLRLAALALVFALLAPPAAAQGPCITCDLCSSADTYCKKVCKTECPRNNEPRVDANTCKCARPCGGAGRGGSVACCSSAPA